MTKSVRVLLVEDSEADARLLLRELTQADYQVTAERVETAEALRQALVSGTWDVVFCDFTMPQFSGPIALQIVKASDLDLPFIYVSGTIGEDVAVEAVKTGAQDYVMKTNLARLVPALERELREAAGRRAHLRAEAERERLMTELQATLAEVRRLSGLLPICSRCRRIRDDQGYWQEVENYIQQHSAARFSHGLCPECLERVYEEAGMDDRLRD